MSIPVDKNKTINEENQQFHKSEQYQQEQQQEEEIDEEKKKYLAYIEAKSIIAGIPKEYLKYSFFSQGNKIGYNINDSNNKVNQTKLRALNMTIEYVRNIKDYAKEGKSLFYYGIPNKKLGISLLGTFILRAAIENKYTAKFVYFPTLCEDLGYNADTEDKEEYYDVDFLMIDSISSKSQTNSKITDGLADLILFRHKHNKPTIFCSYISPEELASRYSEALITFFDECVVKIPIEHEDANAGILYDVDKLIKYFREKKKEKDQYSYQELQSLLDNFIKNYQFQ